MGDPVAKQALFNGVAEVAKAPAVRAGSAALAYTTPGVESPAPRTHALGATRVAADQMHEHGTS